MRCIKLRAFFLLILAVMLMVSPGAQAQEKKKGTNAGPAAESPEATEGSQEQGAAEDRKPFLKRVMKTVTTLGNSEEEEVERRKQAAIARQAAAEQKKAAAEQKKREKQKDKAEKTRAEAPEAAGQTEEAGQAPGPESKQKSLPKLKTTPVPTPKPASEGKPAAKPDSDSTPTPADASASTPTPKPTRSPKPAASPTPNQTPDGQNGEDSASKGGLGSIPEVVGEAAESQEPSTPNAETETQQLSAEETRERYRKAREAAMARDEIAQANQAMFDAQTEDAHYKAGKQFYKLLFSSIRETAPEIASYIDAMEKAASRKLDADREKMKELFARRKEMIEEAAKTSGGNATQ